MAKDSSRDWELLYLFKGGRLLQRESSKLIMLSFLWPDPRVRHFLCDPETCKPHRCRTTRSGGCDYLGTSHVYFYTELFTDLRNRRERCPVGHLSLLRVTAKVQGPIKSILWIDF